MRALQVVASRLFRRLTGASPRRLLEALLPPMAGGASPSLIYSFPERSVLVLAPHADDEALGCGGTLLQHRAHRAAIAIVHLTDGSLGDGLIDTKSGDDVPRLRQALIERRRHEALAFANAVDAAGCHFLDSKDGSLFPTPDLTDRLVSILEMHRPELIYLPFAWDSHEDHWQASRLACAALQALAETQRQKLRLRAYEVWSPLPANCVCDITTLFEDKLRLVRHYASQLAHTDYIHCIRGLNAYRSLMLPQRHGFAEAFFECSPAHYISIIKRMELT